MNNINGLLKERAAKIGIELKDEEIENFAAMTDLLKEWNEKINLTAIKEDREILNKHLIDSLSLLHFLNIKENAKLIDVGSGAGFPGIPIKITRKDIEITYLDSLNKRLLYIADVMQNLKQDKYECVHFRAEEAGRKPEFREKYDVAVARAVADLRILSEYCLPFVKIDGVFAAMKGPDCEGEVKQAEKAIYLLGGKIEKTEKFELPDTDMRRTIIIIRKIKNTPEKYPRITSKINKEAL